MIPSIQFTMICITKNKFDALILIKLFCVFRFEWSASLVDIHRQHLYISVKNNSPLFTQEQVYMGEVEIDLSNLDPEKPSIAWYALQEPETSAGGLLKIKYDTNELRTNF